jgi:hypothetical protein
MITLKELNEMEIVQELGVEVIKDVEGFSLLCGGDNMNNSETKSEILNIIVDLAGKELILDEELNEEIDLLESLISL